MWCLQTVILFASCGVFWRFVQSTTLVPQKEHRFPKSGHATHVSGPFSDSQCCLQWGRETQEMEREGEWTESSNTESVFSPYWLKSCLVFSAAISHKYTFTHSLGNGQENWNCQCFSCLPIQNLPDFAHWSSPIPNFPSWVCASDRCVLFSKLSIVNSNL